MEFKVENGDGIDSWKEVTLVYSAALRQMETKMQILNDEFQHVHQYNPCLLYTSIAFFIKIPSQNREVLW